MEANKKAIELVDKFKPYANDIDGADLEYRKECAIITVDEILSHIEEIGTFEYHFGKSIAFWREVKDEIKTLK